MILIRASGLFSFLRPSYIEHEGYIELSNYRRDAEFAENICFAQSGDGDWAKTTDLTPSLISFGQSIRGRYRHEEHEGLKVRSDCKLFVIFVVDKFYNVLQASRRPLSGPAPSAYSECRLPRGSKPSGLPPSRRSFFVCRRLPTNKKSSPLRLRVESSYIEHGGYIEWRF